MKKGSEPGSRRRHNVRLPDHCDLHVRSRNTAERSRSVAGGLLGQRPFSFAGVAGPGGSREAVAFIVRDQNHGRRIGSGVDPGFQCRIGCHLDHEGIELSFGHGTIPWVNSMLSQAPCSWRIHRLFLKFSLRFEVDSIGCSG